MAKKAAPKGGKCCMSSFTTAVAEKITELNYTGVVVREVPERFRLYCKQRTATSLGKRRQEGVEDNASDGESL